MLLIRKEFMTWFCNKELADYNKYFRPGEEVNNGHYQ